METEDSEASELEQLKARHAQELLGCKANLNQLKNSFFRRQAAKMRLLPADEHLAALGTIGDEDNPAHEAALQRLKRLVAKELLDVAVPTAADTLHKKVCCTGHAIWTKPISIQHLEQTARPSRCTNIYMC